LTGWDVGCCVTQQLCVTCTRAGRWPGDSLLPCITPATFAWSTTGMSGCGRAKGWLAGVANSSCADSMLSVMLTSCCTPCITYRVLYQLASKEVGLGVVLVKRAHGGSEGLCGFGKGVVIMLPAGHDSVTVTLFLVSKCTLGCAVWCTRSVHLSAGAHSYCYTPAMQRLLSTLKQNTTSVRQVQA
jgi:hypothetical protein